MIKAKAQFLNELHEEKLRHKQHRVEFVKQKLFYTIGLFGIGSLKTITSEVPSQIEFYQLFYLTPLVALAFDIYIFAEDFKVKRVGIFILSKCNPSIEELRWEKWLSVPENRERMALVGSMILTFIILISALLLFPAEKVDEKLLSYWFFGSLLMIAFGFHISIFFRNKLIMPKRNFLKPVTFWLFLIFSLVSPVVWKTYIQETINETLKDYPKFLILLENFLYVVWIYCLVRVLQNLWDRYKRPVSSYT